MPSEIVASSHRDRKKGEAAPGALAAPEGKKKPVR
jgi:hypothetical protein